MVSIVSVIVFAEPHLIESRPLLLHLSHPSPSRDRYTHFLSPPSMPLLPFIVILLIIVRCPNKSTGEQSHSPSVVVCPAFIMPSHVSDVLELYGEQLTYMLISHLTAPPKIKILASSEYSSPLTLTSNFSGTCVS